MKKAILTLGQCAVVAGAFWLIFRKVDVGPGWVLMSKLSAPVVIVAFALSFAQVAIIAWRLRFVVSAIGCHVSYRACCYTSLGAAFVNQTPVGVVGADASRIWYLLRGGLALRDAAAAVAIDRIAGLAALVIIVALTDFPLMLIVRDTAMRAAVVLITLAAAGGLAVLFMLRWLPHAMTKFRPLQWMVELARLLTSLLQRPLSCSMILLLGIVGHLLSVTIIYLMLVAFGAQQSFVRCVVLTAFPLLVSLLPISIAGWGVREGSLIAAFAFVGVPPALTLAASVTYGLIMLVTGLPGGLIVLGAVAEGSMRKA